MVSAVDASDYTAMANILALDTPAAGAPAQQKTNLGKLVTSPERQVAVREAIYRRIMSKGLNVMFVIETELHMYDEIVKKLREFVGQWRKTAVSLTEIEKEWQAVLDFDDSTCTQPMIQQVINIVDCRVSLCSNCYTIQSNSVVCFQWVSMVMYFLFKGRYVLGLCVWSSKEVPHGQSCQRSGPKLWQDFHWRTEILSNVNTKQTASYNKIMIQI